jgi:serine O-acetyltransferase
MTWLTAYRKDIQRYTAYSNKGKVVQFLTQQGLWALLQYRIAAAVYRSSIPHFIKRPIMLLLVAWQKAVEIFTGISLPYTAMIGPGLYIGHFGNIIINGNAVIGSDCNLSQGVTIGVSGRGENRGVPVIGNRVYFGANAIIVGHITVGDDVVISGNSLVNCNVPPHCTVVGVPASVVNNKGSEQYLNPQR